MAPSALLTRSPSPQPVEPGLTLGACRTAQLCLPAFRSTLPVSSAARQQDPEAHSISRSRSQTPRQVPRPPQPRCPFKSSRSSLFLRLPFPEESSARPTSSHLPQPVELPRTLGPSARVHSLQVSC